MMVRDIDRIQVEFPDIETCDGLVDELTPVDLACDDPIPFDALGGLSLRCCCITP